jgi:hypothetical protein
MAFCFNVDKLCITIPQLVALSNSAHISTACGNAQDLSTFDLWIVVGEWTPAATDCGVYKLSAHAAYMGSLIYLFSQVLEWTWGWRAL